VITDKDQLDETLQTEFFFADRLAAKRHVLSAGDIVGKHQHNYSHLSIVGYGSVRVTTPKGSRVYDAGDCVIVEADIEHTITALEDSVWYCVHVDKE
jgi:quercetin dioxygenase-like cupin family protein